MRRSAGVLLWKKENNECFVLLTHFGGPYWENNDFGAWSIQKGLVEENEKIYDAAKRESFEETNLPLSSNISLCLKVILMVIYHLFKVIILN